MRPIFWGISIFIIGIIGWVISVVLAVVTLGSMKALANIFGIVVLASIPVGVAGEFIRWIKRSRIVKTIK